MLRVHIVLALFLALAPACGGGGGDPDATVIDAAVDASPPDASPAEICAELCDCLLGPACSGVVDFDRAQCLTDCQELPASVISCRAFHCAYAEAGLGESHCLHALGDPSDLDTPPACLAPGQ